MKAKLLENNKDYEMALDYIESLMEKPESKEINREIELFTLLVKVYEDKHFPVDLPDPIDAILFVMDQQKLKRKDLIPIIGSQSKVSEVLNQKRPLSLAMMRNLQDKLNIPAEVLLQDPKKEKIPELKFSYRDYPVSEMFKLGYFPEKSKLSQVKEYFEEVMSDLFSSFGDGMPTPVYCKQSFRKMVPSMNAIFAWQAQILKKISYEKVDKFNLSALDDNFIEKLLALSIDETGPLLVKDYLKTYGVHFITETNLSKTYVDGAAFKALDDKPVVALSLRHDRIDNFWFTLIHELGHVIKHLYSKSNNKSFFDNTNSTSKKCISPVEKEANRFAMEYLIPSTKIKDYKLSDFSLWSNCKIMTTAKEINRSPAILAGRIRYESGSFSIFSDMLGSKCIKKLFF